MNDANNEAYQVTSEGLRLWSEKVLTLKPFLISFVRPKFDLKRSNDKVVKTRNHIFQIS